MDPFHFECPHCSSRLRVREKLYLGRQIDCPECGQALKIVEGKEGLEAQAIEHQTAAKPAAPERKRKGAPAAAEADRRSSPDAPAPSATAVGAAQPQAAPAAAEPAAPIDPLWRRPAVIVGAGAAVLAILVLAIAFFPRSEGGQIPADPGEEPVLAGQDGKPGAAADAEPQKPRDEIEIRLSRIGTELLDVVDAEGAFPPGTYPAKGIAPENRLSWLAIVAAGFGDDVPPGGAVHWELPWNDPRNEGFVRRRFKAFQNPALSQLTGADGYPAGHFVGVAGVGADAAKLDWLDARAGIFGYDRRTRLDDITDGASNTMLVLGANDHLGSWAAGGPATVRGLSREPYVNGPDGFGTGSPDSMQVLMADGRVITVSSKTDPRILRRMAAKADGLPLDESEQGEPGDRPSRLALRKEQASDVAAETDDEDEPPAGKQLAGPGAEPRPDPDHLPLDPEIAPEPEPPQRKIDLAVSLRQPIARFDQPKSKPLSEVLTSVAEMAGTRIAYDRDELGPAAAHLAEPIALKLENTTVGEILSGLLRPAGLGYRIDGDHLKLVRQAEREE